MPDIFQSKLWRLLKNHTADKKNEQNWIEYMMSRTNVHHVQLQVDAEIISIGEVGFSFRTHSPVPLNFNFYVKLPILSELDIKILPLSVLSCEEDGDFYHVKCNIIGLAEHDFSDFGAENPVFASYFLRRPHELIGLDCSARAQAYWLPSLAHELTHGLLAEQGVESWFEEGLAQLNERQLGGMQPEFALRSLQQAHAILSLREERRPLPSQQSYALSFLFARYIQSVFGGWPTLRGMIRPTSNSDYFEELAENGARAMPYESTIVSPKKMTRKGLLRFFYMALGMKKSEDPRYKIPGWSGFTSLPSLKGSLKLLAGQAAIMSTDGQLSFADSLSQGYEVYKVYEGQRGEHLIVPQTSAGGSQRPSFAPLREFILIVNTN